MPRYLVLFLLFLSFNCFSQEGDCIISAGLDYSTLHKDSDIDKFKTSYEELWTSVVTEKFHSKGLPFRYQFSLIYMFTDVIGFCLDASSTHYSQAIDFKLDQSRVFNYNQRVPFEGGFVVGRPENTYMKFKFGFATSTFTSIYYYGDGTSDMNLYAPLNGVYSANGISYRVELLTKLTKRLKLVTSFGGITFGSQYSDKNFLKGIDNNAINESTFLPTDYKKFISSGSINYPYDEVAKLKSINLTIGLQYQIKLFTKKLSVL